MGEWGWWVWGVRMGKNVIVIFRPVLFHNTVTKETHFIPEQRICLCLCDRFLSICVCLTPYYCLMFRCVWLSWTRGWLRHWAELTTCQTWHLTYTVTGVLLANPLALMEMNGGQQAEAHSVCSDHWCPARRASLFTHCCDCTHSRNSSPALWSFRIGSIWILILTGESHYCPHAWLWRKTKPTFSLFLILNFGEFLDKCDFCEIGQVQK